MRRTFFTLLACALFSFYANTASADQVQQDVLDILSQSKPDVPYLLDMSKKPQYDFVVSQLTAAGFTPQNAPQLYQTINNLVVTDAQTHRNNPMIKGLLHRDRPFRFIHSQMPGGQKAVVTTMKRHF